MRLRTKILSMLVGIFLLYAGIAYALLQLLVLPMLSTFEHTLAQLDVDRVNSALQSEFGHLTKFTADWARWDDTYRFVADGNAEFVQDNLAQDTFEQNQLDLIYVVSLDGTVVWHRVINPEGEEPIELPALPADRWPSDHVLLKQQGDLDAVSGILPTRLGPALVAACPILTSAMTGPRRGVLIMGRFVDEAMIRSLADQTRVQFDLSVVDAGSPRPDEAGKPAPSAAGVEAPGQTAAGLRFRIDDSAPEMLNVQTEVPDVRGEPSVSLHLQIPRVVYSLGLRSAFIAFASVLALELFITLLLLLFLQFIVARPLHLLRSHVNTIGQSEDLTARIRLPQSDEIGQLAVEFNHMMQRLEDDEALRKRTQEALDKTEVLYRRIIAISAEGFCRVDNDFRIVDVNQAFCDMLGRERVQILGHDPSEFYTPESRAALVPLRTANSGVHYAFELEFARPDGETVPCIAHSSTLRDDDDGKEMGRIAFFTDITEIRRAAALREDIERITRHDLKTPLNGIINFPRIVIEDGNLTPEQIDCLRQVESAGYQMLDMINRSLDLYRMEQGMYTVNAEPVDLIPVVRQIIQELDSMTKHKGLRFALTRNGEAVGAGDRFIVSGDGLLCYSMLANLIKNAVEAAPDQSDIRIRMDSIGESYFIAVHNQGIVPAVVRGNFFDKYVTYGKSGGTGLGTYSARLVAETHGGDIAFTTSDADGTTVTVRLPRDPAARTVLSSS